MKIKKINDSLCGRISVPRSWNCVFVIHDLESKMECDKSYAEALKTYEQNNYFTKQCLEEK